MGGQLQPNRIALPQGTCSAPVTPDQSNERRANGRHNIEPSKEASQQLTFEQRSVPSTPTKQRPAAVAAAAALHEGRGMASSQGKSRSEGSLLASSASSAPSTPKKDEQVSASGVLRA